MRKWKHAAASVALALGAWPTHAAIPVIDAAAIAQFVDQLVELRAQLDVARLQLDAMSGVRGFGDIYIDPVLRAQLPTSWRSIYNLAGAEALGLTEQIDELREQEALLNGTVTEQLAALTDRMRQSTLTNKALGMQAVDATQQRLQNIDQLMHAIRMTNDAKGIAELQARIAIEQANIETEMSKLQVISQLQQTEKELMEQQHEAIFKRMVDPSNTGMPRLR